MGARDPRFARLQFFGGDSLMGIWVFFRCRDFWTFT